MKKTTTSLSENLEGSEEKRNLHLTCGTYGCTYPYVPIGITSLKPHT